MTMKSLFKKQMKSDKEIHYYENSKKNKFIKNEWIEKEVCTYKWLK